jgi:hypothetical protein
MHLRNSILPKFSSFVEVYPGNPGLNKRGWTCLITPAKVYALGGRFHALLSTLYFLRSQRDLPPSFSSSSSC